MEISEEGGQLPAESWDFVGGGKSERISDLEELPAPTGASRSVQKKLGVWRSTAICGNDNPRSGPAPNEHDGSHARW